MTEISKAAEGSRSHFYCTFCNQTVQGEKRLYETDDEVAVEKLCEKCGHLLEEHIIPKFHYSVNLEKRVDLG